MRYPSAKRLRLWMAAALCVLASCYPVKQYQSNIVGVVPHTKTFTEVIPLAFVEFDDNGEIFSREQLTNALSEIDTFRNACPDGYAILFIHGWKNNADPKSNNVAGFEQFLRDFHFDVRKNGAHRSSCSVPVMGIYIGWRGARVRVGANFSYWNGSDAAVRAGGPDLEEALFRIMCEARPAKQVDDDRMNLILIGHSFGGRVLEKVMTPYLETQILNATRGGAYTGGKPIKFPLPSLTVLLNEAAPATDAKQFLDFLKVHQVTYRYEEEKKPVPLFLSITSDGDWANHIFLPIGQTAARMKLKTRVYCTGEPAADKQSHCSGDPADPGVITNQSTYYTHSTASIPALYSHYFVKGTVNSPPRCESGDSTAASWSAGKAGKDSYVLCESASANRWNHTPYWVSSMPVSIVPDHSNIFRPELSDTLIDFIRNQLLIQGKQPVLTAN